MSERIEPTEAALDEIKPLTIECKCDSCLESVRQGGIINSDHVYRVVYSKSDFEASIKDVITDDEWFHFKMDLRTQDILVHRAYKIW